MLDAWVKAGPLDGRPGIARPSRQAWRRCGADCVILFLIPLADSAQARAARSGRALRRAEARDGQVEAIRVLMVARRSAIGERTQTIN